jgi:hypothetical protein
MPLFAIGMQNTLVKFYSQYQTEEEKSRFLSFTVLFPLLLIIPMLIIGLSFTMKYYSSYQKRTQL